MPFMPISVHLKGEGLNRQFVHFGIDLKDYPKKSQLITKKCKIQAIEGQLTGEIDSQNLKLNSRARFLSNNREILILCYFRDGKIQKGPRLQLNRINKTLKLRSKTFY